MGEDFNAEEIKGELCPFCNKKTLTLSQADREIPYFGVITIFSMSCENEDCNYHMSDVEVENGKGPVKQSIEISSEEDMNVRVVKSSSATIKIPHIGSIEPGEGSIGYVSNIEGVLSRIKREVEKIKEATDDEAEKKKAKNIIKKITKIMWGQEKAVMTLIDPSGNSAIISEKTAKK